MKKQIISSIASISLLSSCATLKPLKEPEVKINKIQVTSINLQSIQINIQCEVKNLNAKDLILDTIEYTVLLDQKEVSANLIETPTILPKEQTTLVNLPFQFKLADALSSLSVIMAEKPINYEVIGKIKMGLFTVPLYKKGILNIKE